VMGKPKRWRVEWSFGGTISTAEVEGYSVSEAVSAWLDLKDSRLLGEKAIIGIVRL